MLLSHVTLLLCISCSLPDHIHGSWPFYGSSDQVTAAPKNSDKKESSFWKPFTFVINKIPVVKPYSILPLPSSLIPGGSDSKAVDTPKATTPEGPTNYPSIPSPSPRTPHVSLPWQIGTATPTLQTTDNSLPDKYNRTYRHPDPPTSFSSHVFIHTSTTPDSEERSDWTDAPPPQPTSTSSPQETLSSLPAQGTVSSLTGTTSFSTLLRTRQPTVKKKAAHGRRPDSNFDLDLWPPNNRSQKGILQRTSEATKHQSTQQNLTTTELTSKAGITDRNMTHGHQSYSTPNNNQTSSSWISIQTDLPAPSAQTIPQTTPAISSTPTTQGSVTQPVTIPVTLPQQPKEPSEDTVQQSQKEQMGVRPPERVTAVEEEMGVMPESTTAPLLVATRPGES